MPKIRYIERTFNPKTLATIQQANEIIIAYQAQGYQLTLRQLYYQFVARDLIPNKQKEYKRLGSVINDGRLAGLIDWNAIEDRTRNLETQSHWGSPGGIIHAAADSYKLDRWEEQEHYVEVWFEKEALAGVFERVCETWDLPYFACRGYPSQSEVWGAAQRLGKQKRRGKEVVVLHFGDHDPSGIDMTRDIVDRLYLFDARLDVRRLALNMDQIEEYDPPPNPAKESDSRFVGYLDIYGDESWELDALEPSVLAGLVEEAVEGLIDQEVWNEVEEKEERDVELLARAADRWDEVAEFLEK